MTFRKHLDKGTDQDGRVGRLLAHLLPWRTKLVTIYRAYMKICMPEDVDNDVSDKPSKFEFINKHREHTMQKQREYAEYKLEKLKKKNSNKKKK